MASAFLDRAERWRGEPIRLPRGVDLLVADDGHGPTHTIHWASSLPLWPLVAFRDSEVAIELAWSAFMLRRPWSIDDERLQTLVNHPPISRASILGALLSIRFTAWIRYIDTFVRAGGSELPTNEHGFEPPRGRRPASPRGMRHYEARARLTIVELSGLLEVDEPDSSLDHELGRWRWMLHDYANALDVRLHERIEALSPRHVAAVPMTDAWVELCRYCRLDACVGLLLARAAMHDARARPSMLGFVDATSTEARGSAAWWCRWLLATWDIDHVLGERLRPEELASFVRVARIELQRLDAGLHCALLQAFPAIRP